MLKHRPKIQVRIPLQVIPGKTFETIITLLARREVQIESLGISLSGTETALFGTRDRYQSNRQTIVRLERVLSKSTCIKKGKNEFRCRFEIPKDAPPTYIGIGAKIEYEIGVYVRIKWWPDRRAFFVLNVLSPEQIAPEGKPKRFASSSGPLAKEPYLEGSLVSDVLSPGNMLRGAVALGNVSFNRFRALTVGVVARESLRVYSYKNPGELFRYKARILLENIEEGKPIPFEFHLPKTLMPTLQGSNFTLNWFFEVHAEIGWSNDIILRLPIQITPCSPQTRTPVRRALPSVGSDRLKELWTTIGNSYEFSWKNGALEGSFETTSVEVRREHRGSEGIFLIAELHYPSLHLDIEIRPTQGLQRILRSGITLGESNWDQNHYVNGREQVQVLAFGRSILEKLIRFDFVSMSDDSLELGQKNSGQQARSLRIFLKTLQQLAIALHYVRNQIPPPKKLQASLSDWQTLAQHLDAPLETARMAVDGHYDGNRAQIFTEWASEEEAIATWIFLFPSVPVDTRFAFLWNEASQKPLGEEVNLPGEAREVLLQLQVGIKSFCVEPQKISLSLLGALETPYPLVIDKLQAMSRLCVFFRTGSGPYR